MVAFNGGSVEPGLAFQLITFHKAAGVVFHYFNLTGSLELQTCAFSFLAQKKVQSAGDLHHQFNNSTLP